MGGNSAFSLKSFRGQSCVLIVAQSRSRDCFIAGIGGNDVTVEAKGKREGSAGTSKWRGEIQGQG